MARPVRRLPFVLLGLMTVATFGGPVAIGLALRGGDRPDWPPDRPVEWWVLGGISGLVFALMVACIAFSLIHQRAMRGGMRTHADSNEAESG
jgi:hypothetical protein